MTPPELQRQMLRMLDGDLPVEELAVLEAELLANPEARDDWRQLARLHSALESRFASEAAIEKIPVVPIKRVIALQRRRMVKTALTAAAVIFMLAIVTLWMITAVELRPRTATVQTAPDSAYTLTHSEENRNKGTGRLHLGSRLTITHGVAELELPHDVRTLVQAPASVALIDARTLHLDYGQAFFEVESSAGQGFTVVTPHQRIVDLGTAFGVIAREGDADPAVDLHVFEGLVRVDSLGGEPGETITAGHSVRLSGSRITDQLESTPAAFLRELPEKVETLFHDDFSTGLLADREYIVRIDRGVVRSESGEAYAGISDNDGWTFRTGSAAPDNIPVRNPGFEDDGRETSHGEAIAHWHDFHPEEWGWGVDARRNNLTPTEGRFLGRVFGGRTLRQTTSEAIRSGVTYILTLDVGLSDSAAVVRLHGSDSDAVLAEAIYHSTDETWLRNQSLIFTADASHATGQKLGISLTCSDGQFAAFDRIRLGTPGHDSLDGFMLTESTSPVEESEISSPDTGNSAPQIINQLPAHGADSATPGGPLVLQFDQPVKWGRGRIRIRNINDWDETTLTVGDPRLSLDNTTLTIDPPLALAEGKIQMGRVPGWQSTGWTGLRNPAGDNRRDRSHSKIATLDAAVPNSAIRRNIGVIDPGRRYSASVAMGRRDSSEFPGTTIRLLSGTTVLAERTGHTAPAPGESITLAWNPSDLPAGIAPGDALDIEIAPARQASGHLEIQEVRVTAVSAAP